MCSVQTALVSIANNPSLRYSNITTNMKFFIILAIIALVSPLYAQSEEKVIEKRGIYSGIGLGYAGHGGGLAYSAPIITKSIHIPTVRLGYGGYGGYSAYGGYGHSGGYGW
ncbi:cuticle protein 64-like [Apis mellifera carnica]|uniref:Cuticle protein 64-like n=1 Tax=Apis mellifera TaxID=7460 RepID=A0A7M7LQM0_APIME|nr:cuticle protein 64-like [Apis mellifera]KAG9430794.1 cuticle protein 64-like [Apis mellifera carnica]|eukprot:XP_006560496.2 cuticle protein 64-like [Apis mellifera]